MHEQHGTIKVKPTGTTDESSHDLNKLPSVEEIENDRIIELLKKNTKESKLKVTTLNQMIQTTLPAILMMKCH